MHIDVSSSRPITPPPTATVPGLLWTATACRCRAATLRDRHSPENNNRASVDATTSVSHDLLCCSNPPTHHQRHRHPASLINRIARLQTRKPHRQRLMERHIIRADLDEVEVCSDRGCRDKTISSAHTRPSELLMLCAVARIVESTVWVSALPSPPLRPDHRHLLLLSLLPSEPSIPGPLTRSDAGRRPRA